LLSITNQHTHSLAENLATIINNAKFDLTRIGFTKTPTPWTQAQLWKAIQYVVGLILNFQLRISGEAIIEGKKSNKLTQYQFFQLEKQRVGQVFRTCL